MNNSEKKLSTSDKITILSTIISIVVTILLGFFSVTVSLYISKQQVDIKGFDNLLYNSNRTIDTLNSELQVLKHQLVLNEASQNEANRNAALQDEANMNEFASAVFKIGDRISKREEISKWTDGAGETYWWVMYMKEIFLSQLSNTYLIKNDSLDILWGKAYSLMYFYDENPHKGGFSKKNFDNSFGNQKDQRRIEEINPNAADDFISCWEATNRAYEMALKYLKKDERFQKYNR